MLKNSSALAKNFSPRRAGEEAQTFIASENFSTHGEQIARISLTD
jgi:hypothetical protein